LPAPMSVMFMMKNPFDEWMKLAFRDPMPARLQSSAGVG